MFERDVKRSKFGSEHMLEAVQATSAGAAVLLAYMDRFLYAVSTRNVAMCWEELSDLWEALSTIKQLEIIDYFILANEAQAREIYEQYLEVVA